MKKILCLFVVLFSMSAWAHSPDIVAIVNDNPITKYDFEARKKMVITLNNIDASDPLVNAKLNSEVLNVLIEEELLNQHAERVGGNISEEDLDNAIATIEQRNNMPKKGMSAYLKEKGLDVESFRKQIKGELIKHNIINALSQSVSVSQGELDVALINSGDQDFNINAWLFASKDSSDSALKKMQLLRRRLKCCDKIDDKFYKEFADSKRINQKIRDLQGRTQSVALDTKPGVVSRVYKEDNKFKLVFVCNKDRDISQDDLVKVRAFLSNKKMSQKAIKFLKDLRSRAYIKIMMAG